jgi:hypothetical protein
LISVDLVSGCNIAVGDEVSVTFDAYPPASAFSFAVTTSANTTPEQTNVVTVSSQVPTLSTSTSVGGYASVCTIEGVNAAGATGGPWADNSLFTAPTQLRLVAAASAGPGTPEWYSSPTSAGYQVVYMPPGGPTTTDTVVSVDVTTTTNENDTVSLALAEPVPVGDMVNITGEWLNPSTDSTDEVTIEPGTGAGTTFVGEAPMETTGAVTFIDAP